MRGCPLSFFVVGIADFGLMGCCGWKACNILQGSHYYSVSPVTCYM